MAEWISEYRLISIIYSKGPGNLLHPLPVGKKIYSTEPGNRLREGKYLLHDMGNLLRHSHYAQVLISQPLSSPSALCYHNLFHIRARDLNFCPADVYVSPLVLVVLGFAAYTLYGRVRGGHRIAFCTLARRSGCVQQEPAENVCGGYPQEGRGNARVSVRTGASRQQKIRARVAEGSKGRARPKKGDATLKNATAGGQKFGLLALKGKSKTLSP